MSLSLGSHGLNGLDFGELGAEAVERGCGRREAGGIYAEMGLSPVGRPIEHFLVEPESVMGIPKSLPLTPRGVLPLQDPFDEQVTHLVDWVGSESYPNLVDFLEEVRRFGLSRRLPDLESFPWEKIGPKSQIMLVHARTIIGPTELYRQGMVGGWELAVRDRASYLYRAEGVIHAVSSGLNPTRPAGEFEKLAELYGSARFLPAAAENPEGLRATWCPRDATAARGRSGMGVFPEDSPFPVKDSPAGNTCCGYWWEDVEGGQDPEELDEEKLADRHVIRTMPSFCYSASAPPKGERSYRPGFFAAFPLTRLVVVKGNGHERGLEKIRRAGIPSREVDE